MRFKLYRQYGALNSQSIFDAFALGAQSLGHSIVDDHEDVAVIWSVLWSGRMSRNREVYQQCRNIKKSVIINYAVAKRPCSLCKRIKDWLAVQCTVLAI